MPKPNRGESENDFVSRCIPITIHEGTTQDPSQAAAICHSIWRKHMTEQNGEAEKSEEKPEEKKEKTLEDEWTEYCRKTMGARVDG